MPVLLLRPDRTQHAAVLAPLKDAPLRGGLRPSLTAAARDGRADPRSGRRDGRADRTKG